MLQQTNQSFKEFFLIEFTREILRATKSYKKTFVKTEVKKIKEIVSSKQTIKRNPVEGNNGFMPSIMPVTPEILPFIPAPIKKKVIHEIVKEKTKRDAKRVSSMKKEQPLERLMRPQQMTASGQIPLPYIPELSLPATVQYLQPIVGKRRIDLGKLEPLARDPLVRTIECLGPNQKIVVTGGMGRKPTPIILSKEDINSIINKFSEVSRIPAQEGIYKVVVGRYIISAIISSIVGSKFIITKMTPY